MTNHSETPVSKTSCPDPQHAANHRTATNQQHPTTMRSTNKTKGNAKEARQDKVKQGRHGSNTHANSCGPPQTCLLQWVLHSSCWPKRLLCTTVAAQGQAHQAPCRQAPPVLIPTVRHDLSFAHNRANPKLWARLATKINISCYSCNVFLYLSSCCACSHVRS